MPPPALVELHPELPESSAWQIHKRLKAGLIVRNPWIGLALWQGTVGVGQSTSTGEKGGQVSAATDAHVLGLGRPRGLCALRSLGQHPYKPAEARFKTFKEPPVDSKRV